LYPSQTVLPLGIVNSNLTGEAYFKFDVSSNPFQDWPSSDVRVFPQPLKLSHSQLFLQFENLPENATIFIFNSQGKHVITLNTPEDRRRLIWNLKNEQGHQVGSGIYLFYVKSSTLEQQGKFVVIH
jgi:hypothetical protein